MKRYKPKFEDYKKPSLLEAVVNPEKYLFDIEQKLDIFINKIKGKKSSASILAFKLGWNLSRQRIKVEYQKDIIPGFDPSSSFGINEAGTIPDKKATIKIYINDNITLIQQDSIFAKEFKKWFLFVLKHELVHRGQFLAIKNSKIRSQVMVKDNSILKNQLKDKQEIMARAWEIIELYKLLANMNNSQIKTAIKNYPNINNETLNAYYYFFGKDSKEIKLLYKYMYEYLGG